MPESFDGTVAFRNSNGDTIVVIDPDVAPAPIRFTDAAGNTLMEVTVNADLLLGGGGQDGDIALRLGNEDATVHLSAERATIEAGGNSQNGLLMLRNTEGEIVVRAQGADGSVVAGGHGVDGVLALQRSGVTQIGDFTQAAIHADADTGEIVLRDSSARETIRITGPGANIRAGGAPGSDGDLLLFRAGDEVDTGVASQASIHLNAGAAQGRFGIEGQGGDIRLRDNANEETIHLNANTATARLGASGEGGNLRLRNSANDETIHINGQGAGMRLGIGGQAGDIRVRNSGNQETVHINGDGAAMRLGITGESGEIRLRNAQNTETVRIEGGTADLRLGASGEGGNLNMQSSQNVETVGLSANTATIRLGANGEGGNVRVRNAQNTETAHIDGESATIRLGSAGEGGHVRLRSSQNIETVHVDANSAAMRLGAMGEAGELRLRNSQNGETITLDGQNGNALFGGGGSDGDVHIRTAAGESAIFMEADAPEQTCTFRMGGAGRAGRIFVLNAEGTEQRLFFDGINANLFVGGPGADGDLHLRNSAGDSTIIMEGDTGDISLVNADCAEEFDVSDPAAAEPGTVMVLSSGSLLSRSHSAYDKRVVGVISGAGAYRPGLVLDKRNTGRSRCPVALFGKTYCKVDAHGAPVDVGDLLTTAETPGYAMKATDPQRAFGAVIGKALEPLPSGQGLIPILITLQ